jgi:hypothetical protein
MAKTAETQTKSINVTGFGGETVVAVLEPLEHTGIFKLTEFVKDPKVLSVFPYTPICVSRNGSECSVCACKTEEQALDVVKEMCFGTDAVFLFLMERTEIKHGWFLRWLED